MLHGRVSERARIADMIDEAWAGRGAALVLHGQPGAGKSSLLRDAVDRFEGMRVLTTRGVASESPLAFAALQRLLRPVMPLIGRLPVPQASALRAAFGEEEGSGCRRRSTPDPVSRNSYRAAAQTLAPTTRTLSSILSAHPRPTCSVNLPASQVASGANRRARWCVIRL